MSHSIKNRVLSGLMSFVIAVGFVLSTAIPDIFGHTVMADDSPLLVFDSASQVNYSTILGRATDYGIVSDTIVQPAGRHMETNFAVNVYSGDHNFDVDLAGSEPVPFIVGEVTDGSKMTTGKNYNSDPNQMFVVYTTKEIIDGNLFTGNKGFFEGKISFVELSKPDINSNVNSMIDHFIDQSNLLLSKPSIDVSSIYNSGTQTLDLSNSCYKDSTIYIDVEAGSSLQQGIASANFKILKDSSTVVVFNVLSDQNVTLNQYSVILNGSSNEILSTTDDQGNDTLHNKDVDNELARKIIWNVPNASSVNLDKTAGVFLLPNSNTVSEVTGSSAGWVASAGTTKIGAGEFHYIYHNRSTDINNSEYGSFHFAARKAFTTEFNGKQTQEIKNIYVGAGQYEFSFVETESDYSTIKKTFDNVYTDEFGKITFPSLSFKIADIDPLTPEWHFYVIKEYAMHGAPSDISQSTGEIDIAVKVTNNNGVLSYEITEFRYLKAGRSNDDLYKDPTPVVMLGTEFSLGGFYNLYTGGYASLTLDKNLSDGMTDADKTAYLSDYSTKTYKVAVKLGDAYVQDNNGTLSTEVNYFEVPLDGTITINGLIPGEYTVIENESDVAGFNLVETGISINNSATNSVVLTGNSSASAVLTNKYEKIDIEGKGKLSVTKSVTGYTDTTKEYEIALQADGGNFISNINGTGSSTSPVWFKIKNGETITFNGLDLNTSYKVLEKKSSAEVSGYDLSVDGFVLNPGNEYYISASSVSVASGSAQVELKNAYTQQKGNLTIKKSFVDGSNNLLTGSFGNVSFTVTGPDNYSKTINYSEFTGDSYQIPDIPVGTYTITETGADTAAPAGKYFDSMYVNNAPASSASAIVNNGATTTTELVNKYKDNKQVTISKSVIGDLPSGITSFELAIKNSKGEYFNTSTNKFQSDEYYFTIENAQSVSVNLPVGTYTLIEKDNAPTGYTLETTGTGAFTVNEFYNAPINVSNKYISDSDGYKLTVNKVTTNAPYNNTDYEFTVKCKKSSDSNDYYLKSDGTLTTNSSEATIFTVKGNASEEIRIFDNSVLEVSLVELSADVSENNNYTLVTSYSDNLTLDSTNKTGEITITNAYTHNGATEKYGSLTISKTVSGTGFDPNQEFEIVVTFGTAVNYAVGTGTPITTASNKYTATLKAGESVTLTNIPADTTYTVVETAPTTAGYSIDGYEYSNTDATKKITANTEDTVVVKNKYEATAPTGSLTISKTVSGTGFDPNQEFEIVVTFGTAVNYAVGTGTPITTASNKYTATLKAGESVTLTNIPADTTYTVVETAPTTAGYSIDGYEYSNTDATKKITANTEDTVVVKNKYEATAPTGSLTISKTVSGTGFDPNQEFEIVVTFGTAVNYAVGTGTPITTASNKYTATLKAGESVTLTNIPADTTYTVVETAPTTAGYSIDGYEYSNTDATKKITANTEDTVVVKNKYEATAPTGSLTISKTVSGTGFDPNQEFEIVVTFGTAVNYAVGTGTPITTASNKYTATLKAGESVTLTNIPADTTYTVVETAPTTAGYSIDGYEYSNTDATKKITANTEDTVVVKNKYEATAPTGSLTISKTVSGTGFDPNQEFEIVVTFGTAVNYAVGTGTPITTASNKYTATLKAGESVTLTNIPADTTYTVVETAPTTAGYSIDGYEYSNTDATKKITANTEDTVVVKNKYEATAPTGSLTISKTVSGTGFDPNQEFEIVVTFGTAVNYAVGTGTPITTASNKYTATLKAGESVTLTNIPADTTYTVVETAPTTAGYSIDGYEYSNTDATKKITANTEDTVVVKNKYEATAPTGSLTISKTVSGTGFDPNQEFEIVVTFGTAVNYAVGTGTPITTASNKYTATLKAGESVTLTNIPADTTYTVVETAPTTAGYSIDGYEYSNTDATKKITANTEDTVVVKNKYEATAPTGSLTISKTVSGTGFDPNKTFEITVTFSKSVTFKVNGTSITAETYTDNLKAGESVTLSDIPAGTTYSVSEAPISQTDASAGYGFDTVAYDNTNKEITNGNTDTVIVKNTYSASSVPGTLTLKKVVTGCDAISSTPVNFYVKDASGNYFDASGNNCGTTPTAIPVTPGDSNAVIISLPDGTYDVTEDVPVVADYNQLASVTSGTATVDANTKATVILYNNYEKKTQPTEPTNPTQPTSPTTPTSPTNPSSPTTPTETTGTTTSETPVTCSVPISKQDVGGLEINGAVLTITNADGFNNDLSGVTVTQNGQPANGLTVSSGSVSFTTIESSSAIVSGLPVGTYILTETVVPNGYVVAESITFRVDSEGNVWVCGTPEEKVQMIVMIDRTDPIVSQVKVDDVVVPPENYTVNPDKTVTLKDDYTKTLVAGVHRITITYTDGTETTVEITITAGAAKVPATGEGSDYLMIAGAVALISSAAVALAYTFYKRWREED